MTDLRALLAPIRARHIAACDYPGAVTIEESQQDVEGLLAAIEAVAELHEHAFRSVEPWATGYKYSGDHCGFDGEEWPCATITALAAALGSDTTNQEGRAE